MKKAKWGNLLGSWSFLIGVILAVVIGLFGTVNSGLTIALIVIGLIVGFLNVADEEATPFLLSGAVLIIASSLGGGVFSEIAKLDSVFKALLAIFVPATIVVAIKNVFSLAKD